MAIRDRSKSARGWIQGAPKSVQRKSRNLGSGGRPEGKSVKTPSGLLPCAPSRNAPSGINRVWHVAHEMDPLSTTPFFRITKVRPGFLKFISKDGILPAFAGDYVIRKKGVVERGSISCATCHTRLMPDGAFLEGAQGNKPDGVLTDFPSGRPPDPKFLDFLWTDFGAPWIQPRADFERSLMAIPHADQYAGVLSREGTSAIHPPHIPSLIGVQDIKYLDATGLGRHRSIGDLMRYAVINMGLDTLAHYGDFQPTTSQSASGMGGEDGTRYSDEQLYALALYIYSLRPPPNPNLVDARTRR